MRVDALTVADLRCHDALDLTFAGEAIALIGPNGAGKTSALEAVHLATTGLSFRGGGASSLIRSGAPSASIDLGGIVGGALSEVVVRIGRRREQRLDGVSVDGRTLRRHWAVTVFVPDALDTVKRGPAVRRAVLDRAIGMGWPTYEQLLADYREAVDQRNALVRRRTAPAAELEIWDQRVAEVGAKIVATRSAYVRRVDDHLEREAEALALAGAPTATYLPQTDGDAEALLAALRAGRARDLERGTTGTGPHLDDVELRLHGREARRTASQGEQRLLVLALLLTEAAITAEHRADTPILLLDDVLSELDADHRTRLIAAARRHGQVLLSATDHGLVDGLVDQIIPLGTRPRALESAA